MHDLATLYHKHTKQKIPTLIGIWRTETNTALTEDRLMELY